MLILMLMASAVASPQPSREVAIHNAAGALREWQYDPADTQAVFVRDRTLRWYRVALDGDCARYRRYDAVRYTTDNAGLFDRTSRVTFAPGLTCHVTSVTRSIPPASVKRRR